MEESPKDHFKELIDSLKEYVELRTEMLKLQLADRSGKAVGSVITFIIMVILISLVVIFLSIAAAFLISEYFGKGWIGFAIVASFYTLLAFIIYNGRDKLINRPVTDKFIKNIFNDEKDEEN